MSDLEDAFARVYAQESDPEVLAVVNGLRDAIDARREADDEPLLEIKE
jgi:hypothetical protein